MTPARRLTVALIGLLLLVVIGYTIRTLTAAEPAPPTTTTTTG
ncbi:hypothetical protein [Saccharothrix violaceirubra]|uniref:Uncharacterized protein n=1 Tax=Saccharothrix violaceirubra TaxID=413306 RepID=A0A7W7T7A4_9PSEU|nr:hypothetical protein [Saccharothrix violaceirubra]MBB4967897.1 hypothetical protein [Saccharothrix violaceirubra]